MNWTIIFDGWNNIFRTLLVGTLAYVTLVALLRVSGKRTLSKMNAFDLVVTVALGSTLATILLSKDVSLATGIAALVCLAGLQYAVAWLSIRSRLVRRLARSEPRLLVRKGELLNAAAAQERVSRDEVFAAIRQQGIGSIKQVDALILETDGSFSVITSLPDPGTDVIGGVRGFESNE